MDLIPARKRFLKRFERTATWYSRIKQRNRGTHEHRAKQTLKNSVVHTVLINTLCTAGSMKMHFRDSINHPEVTGMKAQIHN